MDTPGRPRRPAPSAAPPRPAHRPDAPARPAQARPPTGRLLAPYAALALALHLGGLWAVGRLPHRAAPLPPPPAAAPHAVRLADSAERQRAVADARAALAAAKKREAQTPPPPLRGQVVEVASDVAPPPPDTQRLAQHDSRAKGRERLSRETDADAVAPSARRAAAAGRAAPPPPAAAAGRRTAPAPGHAPLTPPEAVSPTPEAPKLPRLSHGTPVRAAEALRSGAPPPAGATEATPNAPDAASGGPRRNLSLADLIPDVRQLAGAVGSPPPQYVAGVGLGDETQLNAKQFRYAGFFTRVKHQVNGKWRNAAQAALDKRDPTRQLYGASDRLTRLHITLDAEGAVTDVAVDESCGVVFLDDVAVDAVRNAAPFLHPPKGVLEDDGRLRFAFTFLLTTDPYGGG